MEGENLLTQHAGLHLLIIACLSRTRTRTICIQEAGLMLLAMNQNVANKQMKANIIVLNATLSRLLLFVSIRKIHW